jgi:hypothetical protein
LRVKRVERVGRISLLSFRRMPESPHWPYPSLILFSEMPAYAGMTVLFQLRASTDELGNNIGFKESRGPGFEGKGN